MKVNGQKVDIKNIGGQWRAKFFHYEIESVGKSAAEALANLLNDYNTLQTNIKKSLETTKKPIPKQPLRRFFKR